MHACRLHLVMVGETVGTHVLLAVQAPLHGLRPAVADVTRRRLVRALARSQVHVRLQRLRTGYFFTHR